MKDEDRVVKEETVRMPAVVPMYTRDMLAVALAGVGAGLLTMILLYLLDNYVFGAVMCREGAVANCDDAPVYAGTVALLVGSIGGLIALVQARVYRPLLAVLAVLVGFWGFQAIFLEASWYVALPLAMVLFGAAYALFVWVARLRSFAVALLATIVLVALIRVVLTIDL